MSTSDHSPDESGYVTSRVRRADTDHDDYDPSEHSHEEDSADSSARSSVPMPVPISTGEGTSRGPRTIRTPRKRVLPLRRVTFTVPSVPTGEPSQSRSRSRSVTPPPPAIGVPVPRPQRMTALERAWTSGMADEVEFHRHALGNHRHTIDNIIAVLHTYDEFMDGVLGIALDARVAAQRAREAAQRVHTYLEWVIGAMVILLGMMLWMLMH